MIGPHRMKVPSISKASGIESSLVLSADLLPTELCRSGGGMRGAGSSGSAACHRLPDDCHRLPDDCHRLPKPAMICQRLPVANEKFSGVGRCLSQRRLQDGKAMLCPVMTLGQGSSTKGYRSEAVASHRLTGKTGLDPTRPCHRLPHRASRRISGAARLECWTMKSTRCLAFGCNGG